MEGFEVAIAVLLEKVTICKFFAGIFMGVPLSTADGQFQSMLDSSLPEFYAAVIVFAVKARSYFEARGMYINQDQASGARLYIIYAVYNSMLN